MYKIFCTTTPSPPLLTPQSPNQPQSPTCFWSQYFINLLWCQNLNLLFHLPGTTLLLLFWYACCSVFISLGVSQILLFIEQPLHSLMLWVQYFRGLYIPHNTILSIHLSFPDTSSQGEGKKQTKPNPPELPIPDFPPVSVNSISQTLGLYFPSVLWVKHEIIELNEMENIFFATLPEEWDSSQRFLFVSKPFTANASKI